jgi:hypothetical protein
MAKAGQLRFVQQHVWYSVIIPIRFYEAKTGDEKRQREKRFWYCYEHCQSVMEQHVKGSNLRDQESTFWL